MSPLLLLFGVSAVGYLLGRVSVRGFSLGVAAVLFVGLFVGYRFPAVALPDFAAQLGLVLFVYTVGVASGPGFFASLRLRGIRDNALVLAVISGGALLVCALARALDLDGPTAAGLFAGSLTNTPALAAVVEGLKAAGKAGIEVSAPVLAYSICYPLGVLAPLVMVGLCERWFGVKYATERVSMSYGSSSSEPIVNTTVEIQHARGLPASKLRKTAYYTVNFGRVRHGDVTSVVHDETRFDTGDLVTLIGTRENVGAATVALGRASDVHLENDRSTIDYRRMFVSNPEVSDRALADLDLDRYDAVVTRVRRGDVDLVPDQRFELALGDRVRVLAPKEHMPRLERLFGDSQRQLSEVDVITFGLGITLGLLLGSIELPLPGGASFSLGIAGGPLVAGLVLGRLGRTGPLVWTTPYGVNLTLRQFGVVMFLSAIGIKAGSSLAGSANQALFLPVLAAGALVSVCSALSVILVGRYWLKIPLNALIGILSGLHTQPAVLAYAIEKSGRDVPNVGYAAVFPFAMIAKILLAQIILFYLR